MMLDSCVAETVSTKELDIRNNLNKSIGDGKESSVQIADEAAATICQDGPLVMLIDALFGLIIDVPVTLVYYSVIFNITVQVIFFFRCSLNLCIINLKFTHSRDNTYHLHLEAINTLLVLLSVHIFAPSQEIVNSENSLIYR